LPELGESYALALFELAVEEAHEYGSFASGLFSQEDNLDFTFDAGY
jgi:hypothetical protein